MDVSSISISGKNRNLQCNRIMIHFIMKINMHCKAGSMFVFHGCLLCIVKILLILGGIAQLVDLRVSLRRFHLSCSSLHFCRFLWEMGAGSPLDLLAVDTLGSQGVCSCPWWMMDVFLCMPQWLSCINFARNFGHYRLKIMSKVTDFFYDFTIVHSPKKVT